MSNETARKAKPAMITITDAMRIMNAFLDKGYADVEGTKGLKVAINLENGVDYAIFEICGLSFHVSHVYLAKIDEVSGRLWIYGDEVMDVPIKGLWEESEKRHAMRMEAE